MHGLLMFLFLATGSVQAQPDFHYDVLRSKTLKDEPGQLQIAASGVEYRSVNGKTSIRVPFLNIRQMDMSDPSAFRIETYEMLKRKLSGRQTYVFRLHSPRSIQENENLAQFLSDKVSRPVLASYSTAGNPEFEIPAYHRHVLSGCNGTIQITPKGIRFLSELEPHSRRPTLSILNNLYPGRHTTSSGSGFMTYSPNTALPRLRPFLTGGHDEKNHKAI